MSFFPHVYPGEVKRYYPKTRRCAIEVKGITTGGEDELLAQIVYPIGDRGAKTELEILEGDLVWVQFIGGLPESPLIIGARHQDDENSIGERYYHHANISINTDKVLLLKSADRIDVQCINFAVQAQAIDLKSDALTHNGKNIGETHAHSGVKAGSDTSGPPV